MVTTQHAAQATVKAKANALPVVRLLLWLSLWAVQTTSQTERDG